MTDARMRALCAEFAAKVFKENPNLDVHVEYFTYADAFFRFGIAAPVTVTIRREQTSPMHPLQVREMETVGD